MTSNIRIAPGEYNLFPVFKYFNNVRNMLNTIYPTIGTGANKSYWYDSFVLNDPTIVISLNPNTAIALLNESKSLGAAWLIIENGGTTGVSAKMGNVLLTDPQGFATINTGSNRVIQIDMSRTGNSFSTTRTVSNLTIDSLAHTKQVRDENGSASLILQSDYQYVVDVEGNVQLGEYTATVNIAGGVAVEFDGF